MLPAYLQETLRALDVDPPVCRRILLVDDEPENLDVLAAVLEDECDVQTARSGEQALELLEQDGPVDVIIADQRMPGITGVELLTRIAELRPETIRIVLTAYSDVEPMLDAINSGSAYRFLLKPFDALELRSVVSDSLTLKESTTVLARLLAALRGRHAELEQTLEELRERQKQLLAAERLVTLGRTVSGIVHDLRNASSILQVLLDLARREAASGPIVQAAVSAQSNLTSLRDLLEQLRDFARSNSAEVEREPTDIHDFLTSTLKLFLLEQGTQRCPIRVEANPPHLELHVDRSRIRQSVMALLRNAVQASPEGEVIDLCASVEANGSARIDVRDLGSGMDEGTLQRAQEPFFSGLTPPGLGLGLEVARLAALAHGGSLELHSNRGAGTRARLTLADAARAERHS